MKDFVYKVRGVLSSTIVKWIVFGGGFVIFTIARILYSKGESETCLTLAIIGGAIIATYIVLYATFFILDSIVYSSSKKKTARDLYCAFAILIGPPVTLAGIILLFDKNIGIGFKAAVLLLGVILSVPGFYLYFKYYKGE